MWPFIFGTVFITWSCSPLSIPSHLLVISQIQNNYRYFIEGYDIKKCLPRVKPQYLKFLLFEKNNYFLINSIPLLIICWGQQTESVNSHLKTDRKQRMHVLSSSSLCNEKCFQSSFRELACIKWEQYLHCPVITLLLKYFVFQSE